MPGTEYVQGKVKVSPRQHQQSTAESCRAVIAKPQPFSSYSYSFATCVSSYPRRSHCCGFLEVHQLPPLNRMSDGRDAAPSEHKRIAGQFASAKARKAQEDSAKAANKLRERQFKASHATLLLFFLWIVYVSPFYSYVALLTHVAVFTPSASTSSRKASSLPDLSSTSNQNALHLRLAFHTMTSNLLTTDAGIPKPLIKPSL